MRRALKCALVLLPMLALAQAPSRLGYQGRLLKADGAPQTGVVSMKVTLFDSEADGGVVWAESQAVPLNSEGYYAFFLGDGMPVPATALDGSERWLELEVNGTVLTPRQRVASVPYAIRSQETKNVKGGTVEATSVTVNGQAVIDSTGQLVGAAGSRFSPATHTHAAADVVSGTLALPRIPQGPGSGLNADLLDGQDSASFATRTELASPGTLNGAGNPVDWTKLKSVPAALADGQDDGLTAVLRDSTLVGNGAAAPLGINSSEVQRRVGGGCAAGSSIRSIAEDGTVACEPDTDTDTTYSAGPGLTLVGTQLAVAGCPSGQVLKSNGAGWACAADLDTNSGGTVTAVNATAPLASTGGIAPTLSIARASSTVNGYLHSADFSLFSAKVGSLTAGTAISVGGTPTDRIVGVAFGTSAGTAVEGNDSRLVPAGAMTAFAGAAAPPGWLLANGAAVSRATYAALFAAIGTAYGAGDGSTTFNLPDLRGRLPLGAGAGPGLTNRVLGSAGGAEAHTLSAAQMPSHAHGVNDPGHRHTLVAVVGSGGGGSLSGSSNPVGTITDFAATGISIQAAGSSQAHPIMDPFVVVNHIIKH